MSEPLETFCEACSGTCSVDGKECTHCQGTGRTPSGAGLDILEFLDRYQGQRRGVSPAEVAKWFGKGG
jgi:hypothetical protein